MNQKKFEEALSSYSQLGESPATVTLDTPAGKWIISVQEGSDSWDNFYPVRGKTREDLRQWLIAEGLLSHDRDEFSPEDLPAGCQEIAEKVCRREEAELREREIGAELDMILTCDYSRLGRRFTRDFSNTFDLVLIEEDEEDEEIEEISEARFREIFSQWVDDPDWCGGVRRSGPRPDWCGSWDREEWS